MKTETLTDRLRTICNRSSLTQHELAAMFGVPQSLVCRFLRGGSVSGTTLDRIARRCGVRHPAVTPSVKRLRDIHRGVNP